MEYEIDVNLAEILESFQTTETRRGFVLTELSKACKEAGLSHGYRAVNTRIEQWLEEGKVRTVRVRRQRRDGIWHTTTGYEVV